MSKAKLASKRILEVKIKHMVDESPDTSWIGEYSDRPNDFAIDRATDEFVEDNEAGQEWLQRVQAHLEMYCEEHIEFSEVGCTVCEIETENQQALLTVSQLLADLNEDHSWSRREYRYFNPGSVEPFKADASWIPADVKDKETHWREAMRSNAKQDYERMEKLNAGDFFFIGIMASADIAAPTAPGNAIVQHITSGGLWGIESDSDNTYITNIEEEELSALKVELTALGFSKRAIATAFKSVKKESE